MSKSYRETLALLREDEARLATAIRTNREAQRILGNNAEGATYQVYIQCDWPGQRPIMAEGVDLAETVKEARDLFKQWNGKPRMNCEVFVHKHGIRIALNADDIAAILVGEDASRFKLDDRTQKSPRVFLDSEKLPSAWYADEPTPPKTRELELVV